MVRYVLEMACHRTWWPLFTEYLIAAFFFIMFNPLMPPLIVHTLCKRVDNKCNHGNDAEAEQTGEQ
jgi:hypothetical protein